MIIEETKFITEDGEKFDSLSAAEKWQDAKANGQERELRKKIYFNLFNYVGNAPFPAEDLLEYLVTNKKDLMLLLTDGNLPTKYKKDLK